MKTEKYLLKVLLATIVILFLLTLLLDIPWIKAQPVRQVLVYLIMLLVLYAGYKLLIIKDNPEKDE